MRRYLIRKVKHGKKGRRVGKYKVVYAKNKEEALMKHLGKARHPVLGDFKF